MTKSYDLVDSGIKCLLCGRVSYHPDDIKNRYCGNCRVFLDGEIESSPQWDISFVGFVLDKSGSMDGQREQAVTGFNRFIEQLRDYKRPAQLTLLTFDTEFKVLHDCINLHAVPLLSYNDYQPDGMTALFDAVGHCVALIDRQLQKYNKARAIVVIFTDGQENSSHEFNHASISKLIIDKEALGNWSFVYLSASPAGWTDAQRMGMNVGNVAQFNTLCTSGAICQAAISTVRYLNSGTAQTRTFVTGDAQGWVEMDAITGKGKAAV